MLGDAADDQVDDAFLAAPFVLVAIGGLLALEHLSDVLGYQTDDGIDYALLVEVAAAIVPMVMIMVMTMATMIPMAAAAMPVVV